MIDIKLVRESPQIVRESLSRRSLDLDIEGILKIDCERREKIRLVNELKERRNAASKRIGGLKGRGGDASEQMAEMKALSLQIKSLDGEVGHLDEILGELLATVPNIPHDSTPSGNTYGDYRLVREAGHTPVFNFTPVPHHELAKRLGLIDFEAGARMSGAGFVLFKGAGAGLGRALVNFMLDLHTREHGYTEISPPLMVNRKSMTGTGQLPKLEGDMYRCEQDDLFFIPTAEVPLVNIHREEVLDGSLLPLCYVAYTPCFRREAGSYGKETRGIVRMHQFDKVELVKFTLPENSYEQLEVMLADAEKVIQLLGIPYRIMELPAGEISFASSKTYDIELWSPAQEKYLEVSSVSNCEDFQARRSQIRYRIDGKKGIPHTLNASGIALPRTIVALLENFQRADGTVTIPDVLVPYLGGLEVLQ